MKLIYKGEFKGEDQLPKGELPQNAIKFREINLEGKTRYLPVLLGLVGLLPAAVLVLISYIIHGEITIGISLLGLILAGFFLLPHEILHAIAFGKNAEVELYFSLKNFVAFVYCTKAIPKGQFIFLTLFPTLVLGFVPFIIWAVLPYSEIYSNLLFCLSILNIITGGGDFYNAYNAIRQMPNGSMQQLSVVSTHIGLCQRNKPFQRFLSRSI